jgi:hypothetical protein
MRLAHGDGAERSPSDLRTLAGGKGEREKGGRAVGFDRAPLGFDQRLVAVKAVLAEALEHLGSRIRIALQQPDKRRFARIELTGALPRLAGAAVFGGQPGGHRRGIEGDCLRTLRGVQALGRMEVLELTETGRVDHDHTSQRRANTAWRSTGSSSAATGVALGGASLGPGSRAKSW